MKPVTVTSHSPQHLVALFPPLLIDAERVAASVWQGTHGRRRAGTGETFWQFRRYEAGDGAERIDWRQSARSDKIFVREKEWEAAQTAYIWADASGSMQYASASNLPRKADRAELLMLALASLLLRGGEKIGWVQGHNITTAYGNKGMQQIAAQIDSNTSSSRKRGSSSSHVSGDISEKQNTDFFPPLPLARSAHMVMASDFLAEPEALTATLHSAAARGVKGLLLHITDPMEENFAFDGRVEMSGMEDEVTMLLPNAAALRAAYTEKMTQYKIRLQQMARAAGWFYLHHVTSQPPEMTLMEIYQVLAVTK